MSDLAIRVTNLGKRYHIGERDNHRTLRDVIANSIKYPVQVARSWLKQEEHPQATKNTIWALRDVSFEVNQGEAVGIIGRNGAGKSTLLKILSRITEPTTGRVEGYGRVGSLLEVGTGFHPELTGRENIYLNGAILGMTRVEINRKFDEIVAFSEVEKFLDTPVKRYSSGMYVRLAFAVAAHLEPEILIVDEVLAVGDAAFQKKCLGKMSDVARQGRTVLFVSHNMTAIESLCDWAILLDEGRSVSKGSPRQVIPEYLQEAFSSLTQQVWLEQAEAPGNDDVRIHRACVRPLKVNSSNLITVHTPFAIEFDYWNLQGDNNLDLSIHLINEQGILVFDVGRVERPEWQANDVPLGLFRDICYIPGDLLNDGMYRITLFVSKDQREIYRAPDILVFDVQDTPGMRGDWYGKWPGAIRPTLKWTTQQIG